MPLGILDHAYAFDRNGRIIKADCVIPTSQNNAKMHHDLVALAKESATQGRNDGEIRWLAEMLVRAPCISCSMHCIHGWFRLLDAQDFPWEISLWIPVFGAVSLAGGDGGWYIQEVILFVSIFNCDAGVTKYSLRRYGVTAKPNNF